MYILTQRQKYLIQLIKFSCSCTTFFSLYKQTKHLEPLVQKCTMRTVIYGPEMVKYINNFLCVYIIFGSHDSDLLYTMSKNSKNVNI